MLDRLDPSLTDTVTPDNRSTTQTIKPESDLWSPE